MPEEEAKQYYYPIVDIDCGRFEQFVVRRLMKHLEIPAKYEALLRDEYQANYEETRTRAQHDLLSWSPLAFEDIAPRRLTLTSFQDLFPTFPFRLVAWKCHYIAEKCSLASLFRHPDKLDPFVVYDHLFEDSPEIWNECWVGLVIDWPTMEKSGGLVIHNQPIDTDIPGMRMLWVSPQGRQIVIETLDTVLETMDKRWPDEDGWPALFDLYHARRRDTQLNPTCGLVSVNNRDTKAVEHLIDPNLTENDIFNNAEQD